MKYNLISLMRAGAEALDRMGDDAGRAYALHEAANNMILLLTGVDTVDEFKTCYTAQHSQFLDLDERFPSDDVEK
jgi:hypothetical protein